MAHCLISYVWATQVIIFLGEDEMMWVFPHLISHGFINCRSHLSCFSHFSILRISDFLLPVLMCLLQNPALKLKAWLLKLIFWEGGPRCLFYTSSNALCVPVPWVGCCKRALYFATNALSHDVIISMNWVYSCSAVWKYCQLLFCFFFLETHLLRPGILVYFESHVELDDNLFPSFARLSIVSDEVLNPTVRTSFHESGKVSRTAFWNLSFFSRGQYLVKLFELRGLCLGKYYFETKKGKWSVFWVFVLKSWTMLRRK